MKYKPVLHRLFIKPDIAEEADDLIKRVKELGLQVELDKREQKAVCTGTVISIGTTCFKGFGTTSENEGVILGAKIIYAKYSGAEVPNSDLIMLNDEDVLAVLSEE